MTTETTTTDTLKTQKPNQAVRHVKADDDKAREQLQAYTNDIIAKKSEWDISIENTLKGKGNTFEGILSDATMKAIAKNINDIGALEKKHLERGSPQWIASRQQALVKTEAITKLLLDDLDASDNKAHVKDGHIAKSVLEHKLIQLSGVLQGFHQGNKETMLMAVEAEVNNLPDDIKVAELQKQINYALELGNSLSQNEAHNHADQPAHGLPQSKPSTKTTQKR